jgi:hypothetical protein
MQLSPPCPTLRTLLLDAADAWGSGSACGRGGSSLVGYGCRACLSMGFRASWQKQRRLDRGEQRIFAERLEQ